MSVRISHPTGRPNFTRAEINGLTIWYSYETPIAFQFTGNVIVSENAWSNTTGKHLNLIDGGDRQAKAARLSRAEFVAALNVELSNRGL